MYISNYPEDSILRRHFESGVKLKRQAWQQQPPSDAVLRRHYEQMRNSVDPSPNRKRVSQADAQTVTSSSVTTPQMEKQGLVGWLRRLFGG